MLNESHFQGQHRYRLEWQPGQQRSGDEGQSKETGGSGGTGYLAWYLDDTLIMRLTGDKLLTHSRALIPMEPMYLIFNIAISHRWGMPEPCNVHECNACYQCYDCHNPDCQCSLPRGMQQCRNLPAEMRIDYIRLYQVSPLFS